MALDRRRASARQVASGGRAGAAAWRARGRRAGDLDSLHLPGRPLAGLHGVAQAGAAAPCLPISRQVLLSDGIFGLAPRWWRKSRGNQSPRPRTAVRAIVNATSDAI